MRAAPSLLTIGLAAACSAAPGRAIVAHVGPRPCSLDDRLAAMLGDDRHALAGSVFGTPEVR